MTNKTTQVLIAVDLPDDLCGKYLQHIRDFDYAHAEKKLTFGISARKGGEPVPPPSLPPLQRH